MMCIPCREAGAMNPDLISLETIKAKHAECLGPAHCYCQHRPTRRMSDGTFAQIERKHV